MAAVHAARIPATLLYARSLRNNHLVSEACGLYTAGVLFPEVRGSARWRRLGRRWLIRSLLSQVFDDGGHVQHSINYHRAVLQAGLWALGLGDLNRDPFPGAVRAALARMADFERHLVDPAAGMVPNFGPNDGAELLPLSVCGFADYRPTLQMAAAVLGQAGLPSGPWDEACVWLGVDRPVPSAAQAPRAREFPQAGLYSIRYPASHAMLRCARFRDRPGHSDQLHLSLWRRGRCVIRDPGSYLYNAPAPWDNALAAAAVHNGPVIAGREPMRRAGRFLWLDWAQGKWLGRWQSDGGRIVLLAAENQGYRRLGIVARRCVVGLGEDLWLVVDELAGRGQQTGQVCWLFADQAGAHLAAVDLRLPEDDLTVVIEGPEMRLGLFRGGERIAGEEIVGEQPTWGWTSPTYAVKERALSLVCQVEGSLPLRWATWFCFGAARPTDARLEWRPLGWAGLPVLRLEYGGDRLCLEAA